ncbi:MAG: ABC transporter permease [Chloroflexi bacterium]|nr:ABC transporter permease [Chloroflexota bacterium]
MKAVTVAQKTLRELVREPMLLGLMLFFPIVLVVFYYIAFGQTDQGLAKYLSIWVINHDQGTTRADGQIWRAGDELIAILRASEYDNQPVFTVNATTDRAVAEIAVRERKTSLLLIIPADFSAALAAAATGQIHAAPVDIVVVGDSTSDTYVFARSFLDGLIRDFARQTSNDEPELQVDYVFLPGTGTMSDFDAGVPGVIVFGVMLLVAMTAMVMVRENVSRTLRRLRLTRLRARDLLIGVTLAQMVVALVMIPLTFGVAVIFGFRGSGSLLLAIVIGLLLSLSAVGLGLIVACFAHTDSEAASLGAGVGVMLALVSGAMGPMPPAPLMTIGARTIQLYDFLPTAQATEALRHVLVLGEGFDAILYQLITMTVLSLMLLTLGVLLYQRLQLRHA